MIVLSNEKLDIPQEMLMEEALGSFG
jgi:hypothetical protein